MVNQKKFYETLFDVIYKKAIKEESELTTKILASFIVIAIISKYAFSGIRTNDIYGTNGPASVDIMCYMIIIVSIISIVFLNSNGETNEIPLEKIVSWEMVVLIVYLLWLISINLKHFKRINMRKVPSQYYLYSTLSTLVIFGQTIFFLVNYLVSLVSLADLPDVNFNEQLKRFNFIHYLFMFLNFLLILIQQIILDNFSVDII